MIVADTPIAHAVGPRLREARRIIEREYAMPLTLQRLARRVRLPKFLFERSYWHAYGIGPLDHLRQCRGRAAARLLVEGRSAHSVALLVGYSRQQVFESEYRRTFKNDLSRLRLLARQSSETWAVEKPQ